MKFRKHMKTLFLLLAAAGMMGCVQEYGRGEIPTPPSSNEVTITVTVPGQQIPTTRSIAGGGGEATVAFIDLLVFGTDGKFSRHVPGTDLAPVADDPNYKVTFKAALSVEENDEMVVILANVPASTIAELEEGDTKLEALSKLTDTWESAWKTNPDEYKPIPMYGEVAISEIENEVIELTRMLARVDVENSAEDFTIKEIHVVNYNTVGNIAPAWDNDGEIIKDTDPAYPYKKNENPSAPNGGWGKEEYSESGKKLTYGSLNIVKSGSYKGEIYLYEAVKNDNPDAEGKMQENEAHTNAICLIVRGEYKGAEYYYRIDFTADGDATTPSETRKYMPVYRNHLYTFHITAVNGPGYVDFDDALKSFGMLNNLKTKLHVVDQTGVTNMVFNGQHYIGLGNAVTFGYEAGLEIPVPCVTNYWGGWSIEEITYEPSSDRDWLTTTPGAGANPDPAIKKITLTTVSENSGSTNRVAYIHVKAGRLTHQLTVTQKYLPSFEASPKTLNFGYSASAQSVSITSNINWSVASKPAWCSTVSPMSGTGNGSLNVQVTALSTLNDPTLATDDYKRNAMIGFANPDGISLGSQSITVTQYAPRLAGSSTTLPMSGNIPADGATYTITASANIGWGVKIYSTVSNSGATTSRTAILTASFGGSVNNAAAAQLHDLQITVPKYESIGVRDLEFVLYCTVAGISGTLEVPIDTWQQDGIVLWGGHADILYFDDTDGDRLKIGRWGTEITPSNYQQRMVFTKFGGVVGFTIEGNYNDPWKNEYIRFNPTTTTTITGYGNANNDDQNTLPRVPAFRTEDYSNGNIRDISSTDYHYYHNIKTNGRGDICQLVGLTAVEIQLADTEVKFNELLANRNAEYKGWRLPTARENASFVGGASSYSTWITWTNGGTNYDYTPTTGADPSTTKWPYYYNAAGTAVKSTETDVAGTPFTGRFPVVTDNYNDAYSQLLPTASYRQYDTGKVVFAGQGGAFWSSTAAETTTGYMLAYSSRHLRPVNSTYYAMGNAIRCVRKQ